MNITDGNGASKTRIKVADTDEQNAISQVTLSFNDKTLMNLPEPAVRGQRADALIDTMNMDTYSLLPEAPRNLKMKG